MRVREHESQYAAHEELPLLTESAVVTEVAAMDRNRNGEVLAELVATLDRHGTDAWERDRPTSDDALEEWLRGLLDDVSYPDGGTPLNRYLPPACRDGDVGDKLAALQERYLQPYPSLLRIDVEADQQIDFVAGQYLSVRYEDTTRVYSIASPPTQETIEFCIKRVPGGELTPNLAVELDEGDEVTLRGPYGDLHLEDPSTRDVVFLATGTGVAPFKSMIDYLFEKNWDRYEERTRDVWLFLGAGWRDALPYRDEFRARDDRHANFHFVPTLSREPYLSDWGGETDYVQNTLAKYLADDLDTAIPGQFEAYADEAPVEPVAARLDPDQMEVYACGLTAMVQSLVDAVDRLGVPPEHTQFEGFG